MRRLLMVSPHFPPDSSAGTHRVRLLAPHLSAHGWEPTVVTVDERDREGRPDPALAGLVPAELRVVRCRAWPVSRTRRFGFADLGLRSLFPLHRTCAQLLRRERFDALFITLFPAYPALLGPLLKWRFSVPFILDYQDPWVGAWGLSVGGGPGGRPDLRSRLSRRLAVMLEPFVLGSVDAVTAVSRGTYEEIQLRQPELRSRPCLALPIGFDAADLAPLHRARPPRHFFDLTDGDIHLCYVGTLLPLGHETLDALLVAVAHVRDRRPDFYRRLRLHFFGTSNQFSPQAAERVLPAARAHGVADHVTEVAPRLDYLDALAVQRAATAILLLGSSERHYTASKIYPALCVERPLIALYHRDSSGVELLRRVGQPPTVQLITYDDSERAGARVEAIYTALLTLARHPHYDPTCIDRDALTQHSAPALAKQLAGLLDGVCA